MFAEILNHVPRCSSAKTCKSRHQGNYDTLQIEILAKFPEMVAPTIGGVLDTLPLLRRAKY